VSVNLSRSAWVWRTKHFDAIRRWAMSGADNQADFEEAADSLRCYLERSPENASDVANLAMNACLTSQRKASPDALQAYVRISRDANLIDEATRIEYVVVLLCYAQSLLAYDQRIDGLDALRKCESLLEQIETHSPILQWTRAKAAHLSGGLWELDLERERAREAFQKALEMSQELLDDTRGFEVAWVKSNFGWMGEGVRVEDFGLIARMELERLYTDCAVGAACNASRDASAQQRSDAARAACEAIERFGPSPDMSPLTLADVLAPIEPGEAKRLSQHLLDVIEQRRQKAESDQVPKGLTYGPAIEVVRRALRSVHERMIRQAKVWNIGALLGVARTTARHGDGDGARRLFIAAVKAAIDSRHGLPQTVATGAMLSFEAAQPCPDLDSLIKIFLVAFAGTTDVEPGVFDRPAIRVMVDDAVAVVAMHEMQALAERDDATSRQRSSLLIDLLRRPEPPPAAPLLECLGLRDADDEPVSHSETSLIDRIVEGLAGKSAAALIIQSLPDGVAMLAITGDGTPSYAQLGRGYLAAVDALDSAVQVPLFSALAGASSRYATQTQDAGEALFDTLPDCLKAIISRNETLFLIPDFRGVHSVQPFELMHDGTEFLGLSKVISRCHSLAHLAEVLERQARPAKHSRALVTSAPKVDGYLPLPSAASECESVRQFLSDRGYDAPAIDPEILSADFYRDRLSFVDVLHIAAHGEALADSEWLVLPGGKKLVVDDLLSLGSVQMPFVYLSTCNLARTRHLGAGISRGLAYTFVDEGAPAVLSNSTPVLDSATLTLATAFYEEAMRHPIGEALRRARIESDVSAATWGRAVMFGNPWHTLPSSDPS
jgi:tetratricopeptide (TPR) repeat protein